MHTTIHGEACIRNIENETAIIGLNMPDGSIAVIVNGRLEKPINFTGLVKVPEGFKEGKWNWVQLITPQRFFTEDGINKKFSLNGIKVLDTKYPYEPYNGLFALNNYYSTGNQDQIAGDAPDTILKSNINKASVENESFTMYIMFCPDGDNSKYVPLKSVSWGYSISALKEDSVWNEIPGTAREWAVSFVENTDHPTWNNNFKNGEFIEY